MLRAVPQLFLSHVSPGDSGNYSCECDMAVGDAVQLVVTTALPGSALMFHNLAPPPAAAGLVCFAALVGIFIVQ